MAEESIRLGAKKKSILIDKQTKRCLSLGVLGPDEREYLGDDLKDVNVFHKVTAE